MAINFSTISGSTGPITVYSAANLTADTTSKLSASIGDFEKFAAKPDYFKIGKFNEFGGLGGTFSGKMLLEDGTKFTAARIMDFLRRFASGSKLGTGATVEAMMSMYFGLSRTQAVDAVMNFLTSYQLADSGGLIISLKNETNTKVKEAYKDIFRGGDLGPNVDKSVKDKISAVGGFSSAQQMDEKFLQAIVKIILGYLGVYGAPRANLPPALLVGENNPTPGSPNLNFATIPDDVTILGYDNKAANFVLFPTARKILQFRGAPTITGKMITDALVAAHLNKGYKKPEAQAETLPGPAAGDSHYFNSALQFITSYIKPFADNKVTDVDDTTQWKGPGVDTAELKDLQAIGEALVERPDISGDVSKAQKEMQENIKQCILLAGMGEISKLGIQLRTGRVTGAQVAAATTATATGTNNVSPGSIGTAAAKVAAKVGTTKYKVGYPWGGRIIPLSVLPQEYYLNALNLPAAKKRGGIEASINDYLQATALYKNGLELKFGLFKVVENFYDVKTGELANGGKPIDLPIRFDKGWPDWYGAAKKKRGKKPTKAPQDGVNPFFKSLDPARQEIYKKRLKDGKKVRLPESYIVFKKCDVKFKGGNPATAKSDVQVSMEFFVKDIKYIEQAFSNRINLGTYKYVSGRRVPADEKKVVHYKFSILDLISYVKQNNSKTGFGSAYRDQYHPNYNRLILKSVVQHVPPSDDETESPEQWRAINEMLMDHPLILDLALVDHKLKKNEFDNSVTISIDYRGYVDSILSDPIMDCLQGSKELARNIFNEIKFLMAADEGCSVEQLQNIERGYAELRRQAMADILPRIWNSLDKRNKIFRFSMDIDEVLESLNATKSRITNPEPIIKRAKATIGATAALWHKMNATIFDPNATDADKKKASETYTNLVKSNPDNIIKFRQTWEALYDMSQQSTAPASQPANQSAAKKKQQQLVKNKPIARGGAEKENFSDLDFFFFGDLIDVLMDAQHTYPGGKDEVGYQMRKQADKTFQFPPSGIKYQKNPSYNKTGHALKNTIGGSKILRAARAFRYLHRPPPTKVILPTFNWFLPNKVGVLPPAIEYRTNLADVPISVHWFLRWFKEEILDKNLQYYSVMGMIRALSSTLITRLLNEVCFAPGSQRKVLFRAMADYGLYDWSRNRQQAKKMEAANVDPLLRGFLGSSPDGSSIPQSPSLSKYGEYSIIYSNKKGKNDKVVPLLRKGFNNHVDEYCNYIVVYVANQQGFETTKSVGSGRDHAKFGVPHFVLRGIRPQRRAKQMHKHLPRLYGYTQENTVTSMIDKIDFKKKDAPYRREAKFFASNRGNLAQIAGVYNATITLSAPAFFLYPGQICWIDAGLADRPNNPKSIAFELGLGGYYQIIQVNHKFDTIDGKSPIGHTVVEAVWVNYGVRNERTRIAATFKQIGRNPIKLKVNKNAKCDDIIKEIDKQLGEYERVLESVRNAQSLANERAQQAAAAAAAAAAANNAGIPPVEGSASQTGGFEVKSGQPMDFTQINQTKLKGVKITIPNLPGVTLTVESGLNPSGKNSEPEKETALKAFAQQVSQTMYSPDRKNFYFIDTSKTNGVSLLPNSMNNCTAQLKAKDPSGNSYTIYYNSTDGKVLLILDSKSQVYDIDSSLPVQKLPAQSSSS